MSNIAQLPFKEQIEYFRKKLNIPTQQWNDLLDDAHEQAFTVAGAMEADLLNDLRRSVSQAIENGIPLDEFRKQFREIVAKRGWTGWTGEGTKKGEAWRTKVIYDTNIFSTHAAGRFQQQKAIANKRPYWQYKHSHLSADPREQHLAWDGLILPHDDPFWSTAYPPNGFGCKCYVITLSERNLKAMGRTPDESPSVGEILTGVEEGFTYAPGARLAEDAKKVAQEKQANYDKEVAKAQQLAKLEQDIKAAQHQLVDFEAKRALTLRQLRAEQAAVNWKLQEAKSGALGSYYKKAAKVFGETDKTLDELASEFKQQAQYGHLKGSFKAKLLAGDAEKAKKYLDKLKKHPLYDPDSIRALQKEIGDVWDAVNLLESELEAPGIPDTDATDKLRELDGSAWNQIGEQSGSNPGGLFQDEDGNKYYVKFVSDARRDNEVLAGKLYQLMEIDTPDVYQVRIGNKTGVASKIIDDLKTDKNALKQDPKTKAMGAQEGFGADAWLANWDVVGLNYDNLKIKNNKAYRIDAGGALEYRAQGEPKGDMFGDNVLETMTLKDKNINPQAASVFGGMDWETERLSVARVTNLKDDDIRNTVMMYGPGDYAHRQALADKLIKRKEDLRKQYKQDQAETIESQPEENKLHDALVDQMIEAEENVLKLNNMLWEQYLGTYTKVPIPQVTAEIQKTKWMIDELTEVAKNVNVDDITWNKVINEKWVAVQEDLTETIIMIKDENKIKKPGTAYTSSAGLLKNLKTKTTAPATPAIKKKEQKNNTEQKKKKQQEDKELPQDDKKRRIKERDERLKGLWPDRSEVPFPEKEELEEVFKAMEKARLRSAAPYGYFKRYVDGLPEPEDRGYEHWVDEDEAFKVLVHSWTGGLYKALGRELRKPGINRRDDDLATAARKYREILSKAIMEKPEKFKDKVYRTLELDEETIKRHIDANMTGDLLKNYHPESWTSDRNLDFGDGNVLLVIEKPQMGVDIKTISRHKRENEVMFPLMRYRVKEVKQLRRGRYRFTIEEVYE